MEKQNEKQILTKIYNTTLEKKLGLEIQLEAYNQVETDDEKKLIPEEAVKLGLKQQVTTGEVKKKLKKMIDNLGVELEVIEKKLSTLEK